MSKIKAPEKRVRELTFSLAMSQLKQEATFLSVGDKSDQVKFNVVDEPYVTHLERKCAELENLVSLADKIMVRNSMFPGDLLRFRDEVRKLKG